MAIKYKKGYLVKHPKIDDWGIGVVIEDSNNETVSVSFKNVGKKSLSLKYVEPETVSEDPLSEDEIRQFLQKDRIYCDEPFIDIYYDLKSTYPNHLILIEKGMYYRVLEDDALFFHKEFNYKTISHAIDIIGAGFPEWGLTAVLQKLRHKKHPYIVLSQLPNQNPSADKWERKVTEIFG
ncbi:MAG: DUF3553 domain-containing protein [Candidatus Thioglobus sp.]|jgi:hypothetical protein|nr:DUF3553 domain-containing protein [Candidatus Thioglobus sp.]